MKALTYNDLKNASADENSLSASKSFKDSHVQDGSLKRSMYGLNQSERIPAGLSASEVQNESTTGKDQPREVLVYIDVKKPNVVDIDQTLY